MLSKVQIIWTAPLLLAGASLAAGPQREVAEITVSPGRIHWQTNVSSKTWTLTVSGQGIYLRESFDQGKQPMLQPTTPAGKRLGDGFYDWELRAVLGPEPQAAAEPSRGTPPMRSRSRSGSVQFERHDLRRAIVVSGSFQVVNGSFVMPQQELKQQRVGAGAR